jgi:uncharacterized membrane protein
MITPPVRPQLARVQSVDLLRGLVMIIMAIDHIRDFVHGGSQGMAPEDLTQTSVALFLTRWITHFCAPTFVFLAGTSAYLAGRKRAHPAEMSRFLVTRGLWLVVVELTLVSIGVNFNFSYSFVVLQVIWALGWSMVALAALIHLPWRALLALSLAVVAGHNLLDPIPPERFGAFAWAWDMLHVQRMLQPDGHLLLVAYPLIPWIFVMSAGWCFGRIYEQPVVARRRLLLTIGLAVTVAFVLVRGLNGYGNPAAWAFQPRGSAFTLLSFLNASKYPPSLDYLLMTLGPSIVLLGVLDGAKVSSWNPLLVFGKVPFFYYICHWYLLHTTALVLAWFRYGRFDFLLQILPSFDPKATHVPPDYGYSLGGVYLMWACIIVLLYPLCRWYVGVKERNRSAVFSYI